MAELNDALLAHIMPNASATRRAACLEPLNAALERYDIGTLARTAAFLAQLAHESGELQFMQEIWGPTAAQIAAQPGLDEEKERPMIFLLRARKPA